jgi:hypothetical protein
LNASFIAERTFVRLPARPVVIINPLEFPNWDSLLATHPEGSFFHGSAWARVLHETYGHSPVYFLRLCNEQLHGLLPLMEVCSAVTGRRGVSLPFSDFCAPLAIDGAATALYKAAMEYGRKKDWRYLECRNSSDKWDPDSAPSAIYHSHVIELNDKPEVLFKRLHGTVRRGIRKAQNEGVRVEFSQSLESVHDFFALHCVTRRRHGLPPQPFRFFENIAHHVLGPGYGFVAIARLREKPVAAFLFFHFGSAAIYKFGASDYAFQSSRSNNLLLWEAIKKYAGAGFATLHLGRTSLANEGLRRFKLGFGAREEQLEYRKYDFAKRAFVMEIDRAKSWVNHVFSRFPAPLLRLSGAMLYPHLS